MEKMSKLFFFLKRPLCYQQLQIGWWDVHTGRENALLEKEGRFRGRNKERMQAPVPGLQPNIPGQWGWALIMDLPQYVGQECQIVWRRGYWWVPFFFLDSVSFFLLLDLCLQISQYKTFLQLSLWLLLLFII